MNKLYTGKLGRSLVLFSVILFSFGFLANPNPIIKNNSLPVVSSFNPFGPAQGFGAFAFGDVDLIGSESEGPIAIGGDLIGFNNGYTIGPPNSPNPFTSGGTPVSLLIDGKVIWGGGAGEMRITADGHLKIGDCSNTSVTQNGNITTASNGSGNPSIKVQGSIPQAPGTVCSPNLLDFDAAYTQMNNYSNQMASCPSTTPFPNVTLGAGQNVINTTLSTIGGIQSINMNGTPPGPNNPLIINIDGQGASSGNWTVWNSTPQSSAIKYVIYHFYNIDNLTITANNGLWGSVFAPNTNLTINGNNNIEGQIVSQDLVDAGGEIHGHNNFASSVDGCGSGCTDPSVPIVTSTNPSCGNNTVTLSISGNLNDATNWHIYSGSCGGSLVGTTSSSTFTVMPNSSTTYYVRGEGGCVTPGSCGSVTVNLPSSPQVLLSAQNVTCNGGSNGSITSSISGGQSPYSFVWSTGATSANISNLSAGNYSLTVTDANNCIGTAAISITQPPALSVNLSTTNASCGANASDGTATASVTGGTPGYTYFWLNGQTSSTATGLAPGPITVTVTDSNGCTFNGQVTVGGGGGGTPNANCKNITVELDESGQASITAADIDNGSDDGCGGTDLTLNINQSDFDCDDIGEQVVTLTVTASNGDTDSCNAVVSVEDNLKPSLECQDLHVVLDESGEAEVTLNDFVLSYSDNCAIDEVYFSGNLDTLIDCSSVGMTIDIGIRARDTSGNVKSCQVVLTVEDDLDPIAECPDDIIVDTDPDACNAEVDYTLPNSSDNCDVVSSSADIPSGSVFDIGTTTVTVTATEFNEQKLLDPNGGANARMGSAVDVTEDYMAISSINVSSGPGKVLIYEKDAQGEWIFTQEVSASDGVGDNNFGFDLQLSGDRLLVSAPNADAGGVNNAGAAYLFERNSSGVWVEDVKLFANDPQNNSVFGWSCSIDDEQVLIGCMWDDTQGFDAGAAYYFKKTAGVWSQEQKFFPSDPNAIDNFGRSCGIWGKRLVVSSIYDDDAGDGSGSAYVFERVSGFWVEKKKLTASDASAVDLFGVDVSIDDLNIVVGAVNDDDNGSNSGSAYVYKRIDGIWTEVQKLVASDGQQDDAFGVCVDVSDGNILIGSSKGDSPNTPNTGRAYVFEEDGMGFWNQTIMLSDLGSFSSGDLVGSKVAINGKNAVLGAIFDDTNGASAGAAYVYNLGLNTDECTFTITVEDNEPPTAVCQDVVLDLDANGMVVLDPTALDGGSTDNCGSVMVTISAGDLDWTCADVGDQMVTLIVLDANGNMSTCESNVEIRDVIDPDAVCKDITIQLDADGNAVITAEDIDGGSTDVCGIASLSIDSNDEDWDCDEVGSNTVTLTVTDTNGNESSCNATVTVEDNVDPEAVCQNITIQLDSDGNASITAVDIDGGSTDACGVVTLSIDSDDEDWGCDEVGSNTVTLTITDTNGNESSCNATVAVEDNVDPEAVCQDITIQLDENGEAFIVAVDIDGGSTDACGVATIAIDSDDEDWGCDEVGSNTVTLTVTDTNGNESSCDATVTVEDNVDPEAVCQDITIQLDENGNTSITAVDIDGGSTDACGVATIAIDSNDEDWGCDEVGSNTVTLTVTDTNGNESSCDATVTVEDNVDPEAVCQDITIQLDENGEAFIVAADIDGGSTDACGIASLAIDSDDEDWGCDEVGSNTVTLTVTDTNGNESSCDATVTVEDNVAPEALCQDITIQLDENGEAFIVAVDIDGGSNDACGIESISITADDEDWDCDEVGENSVILTVTDINGNESSCEAIVTVEDNIPPTLDCPDVVINLDPGLCGQVVQYAIETSDNCGVDSEVLIDGPASETYLDYHDSPWSVTWEVTDVNGNTSSCTFTITMNEYSNPTETLVCNDLVNIALDEDGCSEIGADMLLEGGPYGCYDDYIVDINFEGAEVCCEDIDETLYYTVTDPDTGNSCSGYIEVYDAIGPYCDFEEEIVVSCIDEIPSPEDTQSSIGFYDNCGIESIFLVSEELEDDDICDSVGEMVIVRIWGATDESGNAATELCEQHIVIEREDVFFPADATFDCASYTLDDLDPSLTGYPTAVQSSACAYEYNYSDVVLPSCGGLSQIVRTWTVLDICTDQIITTDGNGTSNIQIIELIDTAGPSIDASEMTLYTDSDQCAFTGFIAAPSISDNCTGVISVQMFIDGLTELVYVYDGSGIPVGGYVEGAGMELGTYTLTITATDACGNISTSEVDVTIEDNVTPTAICDEITQVALQSDGTAEVFAETFDDGSHDNCCLEGFDVRRMDGAEFGATVSFDCSDIGATTQVILRVHDCHGNTNSCMVEVLVEDKIAPYLAVPAGTEISCEDYFANIAAELDAGNGAILDDLYGEATYGDNCEAILDYSYTYGVDQCGEGTITRSWTVNDPSGNGPVSGTQTITIYHVSDWSISFPGDLDATCVDGELPDFGTPTVSDDDCEMIAISYIDTQFDVVPDACYKIVREWSAINWCTYPDEAAVTATQVIKVTDDEAPIFDVEDFTVEITEADCDVAVTLPTPDVTDCSDDITIEISSDLPAGEAGPGTYTATYTVSDGCGNFSYDVITITVVDAKKPTPYVTDHLVTEIMQTGMTQLINVNDYDIGSFDNCSDVVLSFSPDVTDTEVQFTCDDIGENTLEIWVKDEAGNQDFVTVTMEVQDNMEACGPGSLTVAGALHTSDEQGIEDATVDINGGLFTQVTDETGTFGFDLETGGDYSVVPSLDLNASNGVTTFDIVLITQHILGMNPFTDPLNLIAADANNSNTVTTLDVVAIRMVILQITDAFPNNTSWRFVDKDHVFTEPTNPWDFPEVVNINNLDEEMLDVDFTGIKIGDVNGSAQANFMSPAENRSGNSFELKTMDKQVSAGDEVRVTLQSDARISGMQFTLEHNGLEYKGMEAGLMNAEHIASHESALTFSWNEFELKDLSGEDLVTLIFEAKSAVQLSESMVITSSMTKAEGYTEQGIESVDLVFENNKSIANVLYQNVPNPFDGQTVVSFRLNKAGKAQILITDVDGKLIQEIEGTYPQGLNSVELDRIQKSGVYYYQLNTEGFTATKKMIKI